MKKLMFVCMGNVCRSPLAHILMNNYLEKTGLKERVAAESSGVNVYSEGQRACENIRSVSARKGIPFDHYSRRFRPSDLEVYDLILAMDEETMFRMNRLAAKKSTKGSIRFFRDFDPVKDKSREVPDPWNGTQDQSEKVFEMIERTIKPIVDALT